MTYKEFAVKLSNDIKKNPSREQIVATVDSIQSATVNGQPISQREIQLILNYMTEELGNLAPIKKQYDNQETLTFMEQIQALINASKK